MLFRRIRLVLVLAFLGLSSFCVGTRYVEDLDRDDDAYVGLNGSANDPYVQTPPPAAPDSAVQKDSHQLAKTMKENGTVNEELIRDYLEIPLEQVYNPENYQEYNDAVNKMGILEARIERGEAPNPIKDLAKYKSVHFAEVLSDTQIKDIQSPLNLNAFYAVKNKALVNSAFHPNNGHILFQVNDMIRTLRGIKNVLREELARAIEYGLAIILGDILDTSQYNELRWAVDTFDGLKRVHPDSGRDDDPYKGLWLGGLPNDYHDPFRSHGFRVPWYTVVGNHDGLMEGNFPITESKSFLGFTYSKGTRYHYNKIATGNYAYLGFEPDLWELVFSKQDKWVPSDGDRKVVDKYEYAAEFFNTSSEPRGHGFTDSFAQQSSIGYTLTTQNGLIKYIVFDSQAAVLAWGKLKEGHYNWIKNEIASAEKNNQLVIVASHHAPDSISETPVISDIPIVSGIYDYFADDGVEGSTLVGLLNSSPNVIMHLVAHTHANKIKFRGKAGKPLEYSYWEVNSGSLVSWPQQLRIVEVAIDPDSGYGKIFTTMVNHEGVRGRVGDQGRYLSYLEYKKNGDLKNRQGEPNDRNTVLNFKAPQSVLGRVKGDGVISPSLNRVIP